MPGAVIDMKIYSWNMLFSNKELDRALAFIRDGEWDIFCLQEVPEEFLSRLRTLPVGIAVASESDRMLHSKRDTIYSVLLSRYPIQATTIIPLPFHDPHLPLRVKIFTRFMFMAGVWTEGLGNRNGICIDIQTTSGIIRILNLHLILLTPAIRLKEFEMAMLYRDYTIPTIICGDFNTIESWRMAPLNWLLGGKIFDTLFYTRERAHLEKLFAKHSLTNPLRGQSTHVFADSQLDHILVSKHFSLQTASVLPNRLGSDHHPIFVETVE